ncbi:hypothetical protein GCM10007857_76780 [Bradyrhizobium iriomotense]|uniref:Uncharacterized protein n=1 Tax=Bradyrhizobium iriomotense TaxID=441950 RepID=A0ABQ6BFL9_9BRAD|nr:hypothetical protein GCM10007857_76780 [Bradyrhizobium iriomotense]
MEKLAFRVAGQAIKRARVNDEAGGGRIAKVRCHCGENRALHVAVAVEERIPKPAESMGRRDELAVIVRAAFPKQSMGVL